MCICKLRDILFPTNVTGADKRVISYDITNAPHTPPPNKHLNIQYNGELLQVCFTYRHYNNHSGQVWYEEVKQQYSGNGNVDLSLKDEYWQRVNDNVVYFNCTNVTSLIVNGDTLI